MSWERVELLKERSRLFLDLARELLDRGLYDLAAFAAEQAAQLRIKASLLRLTGEYPRIHYVRELLGVLAYRLEEAGYLSAAKSIREFVGDRRGDLIELEEAYIGARYGLQRYIKGRVAAMIRVVEDLFKLLERVESSVLDTL